MNIVWSKTANYRDDEKRDIRKTYFAEATYALGRVDIQLVFHETEGTATDVDIKERKMAPFNEEMANVYFTRGR